ncbi:hypothetical protein BJX96DRAFT_180641 [Aspergillus floccosus]
MSRTRLLKTCEIIRQELYSDTTRQLAKFAQTQAPVEVPDWMQLDTFDVIGEITTSQAFGFMEQGWDFNTILRSIYLLNVYASQVGIFSEFHAWIAWLS